MKGDGNPMHPSNYHSLPILIDLNHRVYIAPSAEKVR